ncbi:MAG: YkoF family thiamine/hydroxymethylpyrimidine-binding protein [Bacteroidales bacterium]
MKVSIELSLYPLSEEYIPQIIDFIHCLKQNKDVEMEVNDMSTQIFGEYSVVMSLLTNEIEKTFKANNKAVVVMKILNVGLKG